VANWSPAFDDPIPRAILIQNKQQAMLWN
jgi:hypothetical protein